SIPPSCVGSCVVGSFSRVTCLSDRLPATFAHHNIRPATASPHPCFEHHLIRRGCFSSWQCLPMRYAENMGVFAPWISALECEFQRVDAVSVLMITVRAFPVIASGHLRVEHIAEFLY